VATPNFDSFANDSQSLYRTASRLAFDLSVQIAGVNVSLAELYLIERKQPFSGF
jgi:hypothetical protein